MDNKKQDSGNRESAAKAFYKEIAELRPRLPKDWRMRFVMMYPAYDNYQGGLLLHNIIQGRSTRPEVLEGMKEIIRRYEAEKSGKEVQK